jgi:hypothetical protein
LKPSNTDGTINNNSTDPLEHKLAEYRSDLQRMNRLPLNNKEGTKELNIILNIAINNSDDTKILLLSFVLGPMAC